MEIVGYGAMLFVGVTLGLLGGGGAILTVPILVYLFSAPAVMATSYSLFVVGISSLFGVWSYHQKKLVDYRAALTFALPSFIGTYLARRVLLPLLPSVIFHYKEVPFTKDQLIMTIFALVMVGASASMIQKGKVIDAAVHKVSQGPLLLVALGLAVGFVAGFVGAGGGFLIIPSLVVLARMSMPKAVGTSLLIISANSLFGFGGDLLAHIGTEWPFLMGITSLALLGTWGGTRLAHWVPASQLKPTFGWFVLVMGSYIILRQWAA